MKIRSTEADHLKWKKSLLTDIFQEVKGIFSYYIFMKPGISFWDRIQENTAKGQHSMSKL